MGSSQTKPSLRPAPKGFERVKKGKDYGKGEGFVAHRRSTSQRYEMGKEPGQAPRPDPPRTNKVVRRGGGDGRREGGGKRREQVDRRAFVVGDENELVDGWPKWLVDNVPRDVLASLVPKSAESYDKIDKIGEGTYSNVYRARDRETGMIVALKKVRFNTSEPESIKFMAREIMILLMLDHPNVLKLEGLAVSRMQYSIYLVFEFMQTDLSRIITRPEERLTEPQIKCYMQQLLSGLQHCHERGVLHRDLKGSNILIDKNGMLKIADFGLANYYNPDQKRSLTSLVVTLWYRAPELLLGATDYGPGIDLWSAGCLLAEMFRGRPIMPGRTEVEQLHKIFKLCGTPSEDYWKRQKLSTTFRPPQIYKPSIREAFRELSKSASGLLRTLLALDPSNRGSASSALRSEFFKTLPLPCDLSGLPVVYKEIDEPIQIIERRKRRSATMRRRPQTNHGHGRKDETAETPNDQNGIPKEEIKKITLKNGRFQEPGSSSSSTKQTQQMESSPLLLSPVASPHHKMTPDVKVYTNSSRNRPPLPTWQKPRKSYSRGNGNLYRFDQIGRSASTREFSSMNQRKQHEMYAIDD